MAQRELLDNDLNESADGQLSVPNNNDVIEINDSSDEEAAAVVHIVDNDTPAVSVGVTTTTMTTNAASFAAVPEELATTSAAAANAESRAAADEQATGVGAASGNAQALECPICLQACIHPTRLPCGHVFCFLCVKGVAYKNRRCAMCRREIPLMYLRNPHLVNGIEEIRITRATEDGYQWFYEGRNGWWQYDERTSQDIEEAFKKGEKSCTILVAGYVYTVDLETMTQIRQNDPVRCRRVKRDLATIPKKGVAGLRIEGNTVTSEPSLTAFIESFRVDLPSARSTYRMSPYQRLQQLDAMYAVEQGVQDHQAQPEDEDEVHDVDDDETEESDDEIPLFNFVNVDPANDVRTTRANENENVSEFISTLAAAEAIRIAGDIIDSTLAHADEATHSNSNAQENASPLWGIPATAYDLDNEISTLSSRSGEHNLSCMWCSKPYNVEGSTSNTNGEAATVSSSSGTGRCLPTLSNETNAQETDAAATVSNQDLDFFERNFSVINMDSSHENIDGSLGDRLRRSLERNASNSNSNNNNNNNNNNDDNNEETEPDVNESLRL